MAKIAKILTMENQNSISPKNLTCSKLIFYRILIF
ncbi:hypothetical protein K027_4392, partial [Acinetobacter baumannii 45057_1]